MKKRPVKWLVLPLLILLNLALMTCSIFDVFDEHREQVNETRDETYSIDSSTLLDSIKSEKTNAFSLLKATPAVYPAPSAAPVGWTQADYFSIAQAFHQFAWKESLAGWKLGSISFGLDCKEVSIGPQQAGFKFYKLLNGQNNQNRLEHRLFIDAKNNDINLDEFEIFPNAYTLASIDLSKAKITMQDALQIAEKNGGTKTRSRVNNNCYIGANYDSNAAYDKGWYMIYTTTSGDKVINLLWLDIDAQTGASKVVAIP
jgi:hypothetical protein